MCNQSRLVARVSKGGSFPPPLIFKKGGNFIFLAALFKKGIILACAMLFFSTPGFAQETDGVEVVNGPKILGDMEKNYPNDFYLDLPKKKDMDKCLFAFFPDISGKTFLYTYAVNPFKPYKGYTGLDTIFKDSTKVQVSYTPFVYKGRKLLLERRITLPPIGDSVSATKSIVSDVELNRPLFIEDRCSYRGRQSVDLTLYNWTKNTTRFLMISPATGKKNYDVEHELASNGYFDWDTAEFVLRRIDFEKMGSQEIQMNLGVLDVARPVRLKNLGMIDFKLGNQVIPCYEVEMRANLSILENAMAILLKKKTVYTLLISKDTYQDILSVDGVALDPKNTPYTWQVLSRTVN